ncbi:hypothetical protein [Embleya sp. AB8]|uniref:hypothetical protein n=1 Tax=Embleya sp. AB8 TaxID=3156304 RepID=UPI003C7348E5
MPDEKILRGPDGRHWVKTGERFDEVGGQWWKELTPAAQGRTGRWQATGSGDPIEVAVPVSEAGYVKVSADSFAEPAVARLHSIVGELLADYARDTGRPHPRATELHNAVEDVAALPEQIRRGSGAAQQAARSGYRRGARRR